MDGPRGEGPKCEMATEFGAPIDANASCATVGCRYWPSAALTEKVREALECCALSAPLPSSELRIGRIVLREGGLDRGAHDFRRKAEQQTARWRVAQRRR